MREIETEERTKKVTKKPRNRIWWIGIHLVFTGTWLGTTLVLLILAIMETSSMNVDVRLSITAIVYSIDGTVMRIAGVGAILTGVVLSGMFWGGFTRFYWVIVKELASLSLFIFGLTWLEPLEHNAQSYASLQGTGALHNAQFMLIHQEIIWTLISWFVIMVFMIFISKLKPWGKTRIGYSDPRKQDSREGTG